MKMIFFCKDKYRILKPVPCLEYRFKSKLIKRKKKQIQTKNTLGTKGPPNCGAP